MAFLCIDVLGPFAILLTPDLVLLFLSPENGECGFRVVSGEVRPGVGIRRPPLLFSKPGSKLLLFGVWATLGVHGMLLVQCPEGAPGSAQGAKACAQQLSSLPNPSAEAAFLRSIRSCMEGFDMCLVPKVRPSRASTKTHFWGKRVWQGQLPVALPQPLPQWVAMPSAGRGGKGQLTPMGLVTPAHAQPCGRMAAQP